MGELSIFSSLPTLRERLCRTHLEAVRSKKHLVHNPLRIAI